MQWGLNARRGLKSQRALETRRSLKTQTSIVGPRLNQANPDMVQVLQLPLNEDRQQIINRANKTTLVLPKHTQRRSLTANLAAPISNAVTARIQKRHQLTAAKLTTAKSSHYTKSRRDRKQRLPQAGDLVIVRHHAIDNQRGRKLEPKSKHGLSGYVRELHGTGTTKRYT